VGGDDFLARTTAARSSSTMRPRETLLPFVCRGVPSVIPAAAEEEEEESENADLILIK